MPDTTQPPSSSPDTPAEMQQRDAGVEPRHRLVQFGRRHPALTVAGLAGAGLLGGIEMAAGVLLGAGVAALIRRPNGTASPGPSAPPRRRMRRLLDRMPHDVHDLKERARAVGLAAAGQIRVPPTSERDRPAPPSEPGAAHEAPV